MRLRAHVLFGFLSGGNIWVHKQKVFYFQSFHCLLPSPDFARGSHRASLVQFFCAVCYVLFSLLYAQSVSNKNQSWTVVKAVRQALIMNDAIGLSSEYNVDKWVFTAKKKSVCTFAVGGGWGGEKSMRSNIQGEGVLAKLTWEHSGFSSTGWWDSTRRMVGDEESHQPWGVSRGSRSSLPDVARLSLELDQGGIQVWTSWSGVLRKAWDFVSISPISCSWKKRNISLLFECVSQFSHPVASYSLRASEPSVGLGGRVGVPAVRHSVRESSVEIKE